jgi:hypothetical protein
MVGVAAVDVLALWSTSRWLSRMSGKAVPGTACSTLRESAWKQLHDTGAGQAAIVNCAESMWSDGSRSRRSHSCVVDLATCRSRPPRSDTPALDGRPTHPFLRQPPGTESGGTAQNYARAARQAPWRGCRASPTRQFLPLNRGQHHRCRSNHCDEFLAPTLPGSPG